MEQYNQPGGIEGTVAIPKPATIRTGVEVKVAQLEDIVAKQHHEIAKLHRDISRLKSDISDIVNMIKSRG